MKRLCSLCCLLVSLLVVAVSWGARAQPSFAVPPPSPVPPPTTPKAQRNAMMAVRAQADWLRSATRTSTSLATGADSVMWRRVQSLRRTYGAFKASLTPLQLQTGANELAELDAGLDILEQLFQEYHLDLAAGRRQSQAFNDLRRVVDAGAALWLQDFNQMANHVRAGSALR